MRIKINNIDTVDYNGPVYNMELIPNHPSLDDQYYIDINTGLVIHNCHPRDNIALRWMAKELNLGYDLFAAIMKSREAQAYNLAMKLRELAAKHNLPVIIHGRAYKPGVPYIDGSYSELVGDYVTGWHDLQSPEVITYADPLTGDWVANGTTAIILMAHNESVTYNTNRETRWYFKPGPGSIIVDPWRKITSVDGCTVIHYGNTRSPK